MGDDWSPYAAVLAGSAVGDVAATIVVWRRGGVGRHSLCVVLLAATVWSLAYAVELAAVSSPSVREIGGSLKYVGTTVLPPAWLIFALQYTGRIAYVGRRLLGVLLVEPLLVLSLLACPPTRSLMRSYPPGPPQAIPIPHLGVAYWVHFVYTNVLVLIGSALMLIMMMRISRLYRQQIITLLVAICLPPRRRRHSRRGVDNHCRCNQLRTHARAISHRRGNRATATAHLPVQPPL